jgi:hypothetical protein
MFHITPFSLKNGTGKIKIFFLKLGVIFDNSQATDG